MDIVGLVAVTMALGIPLSAIIGGYYIKLQKMRLERGGFSKQDKQLLEQVLQENDHLRHRIANLEEIVTDPDGMKISTVENQALKQEIDTIKFEIKKIKASSVTD